MPGSVSTSDGGSLWSMDNLCEKMDAVAPKLGKRGPYKTKAVA